MNWIMKKFLNNFRSCFKISIFFILEWILFNYFGILCYLPLKFSGSLLFLYFRGKFFRISDFMKRMINMDWTR